ncbi:MAG: hypothetical protein ABI467_13950 [Kofleriaceae bacterium]
MKTALALVVGLTAAAHADSRAWSIGKTVIGPSATMVGGLSASSLRSSEVYAKLVPLLMARAGEVKDALDSIEKACKLDVLAAIDSVAFGVDRTQAGSIVIALKGTNHKALDACARARGTADHKPVTITTEGKLTRYEGMTDQPMYVRWLASDVVAISTTPDDKAVTTKLLGGGVTSSKPLKAGLAATDKSASAWWVYSDEHDLPNMAGKLEQIWGSAKVKAKQIEFTSHMVTDSPASAQAFADEANKQLAAAQTGGSQALQTALAHVTIKLDHGMVAASGSITSDDVFPLLMSAMM